MRLLVELGSVFDARGNAAIPLVVCNDERTSHSLTLTTMANFSDGTLNGDLSEGEALASAGNMHKYLQTLLDNKEKQVQQAGTLGQRLLSQHAELEELVRQLQDIDGDKSEDAEISAELRLRYRDLVNTLASWEEENKQLSNAFAIKVDAFFKFNKQLELIESTLKAPRERSPTLTSLTDQ